MMENIVYTGGRISEYGIESDLGVEEIYEIVFKQRKILIIKELFAANSLMELRKLVFDWGQETEEASVDDFRGNYHMKKAKISNLQQVPHVFHDYNFNNFQSLSKELEEKLTNVFQLLTDFYNSLTDYNLGLGVKEGESYIHPQFIQYPNGGGFFGRHSHNLYPQKIGFILSVSEYGKDYNGGGTVFILDNGDRVELEGIQNIGDLCLWPNDIDHWVTQGPLDDPFTWDMNNGRWVITLANFNPFK